MFELALAMARFLVKSAVMERRAGQVGGLVLSALLAFSCSSGQTGSPSCVSVLSCECDSLAGKSLVQANVLSVDDSATLVARIIRVS